ncbi:15654_t:CDS:2, partial [Dentiscutata erythropus]
DLPSNHSNIRYNRENNEKLCLVEDNPIFIGLANINRHIVVWLQEPENYEFHVREIIYNFGGCWKFQDISKRCQLPTDNTPLTSTTEQDETNNVRIITGESFGLAVMLLDLRRLDRVILDGLLTFLFRSLDIPVLGISEEYEF